MMCVLCVHALCLLRLTRSRFLVDWTAWLRPEETASLLLAGLVMLVVLVVRVVPHNSGSGRGQIAG